MRCVHILFPRFWFLNAFRSILHGSLLVLRISYFLSFGLFNRALHVGLETRVMQLRQQFNATSAHANVAYAFVENFFSFLNEYTLGAAFSRCVGRSLKADNLSKKKKLPNHRFVRRFFSFQKLTFNRNEYNWTLGGFVIEKPSLNFLFSSLRNYWLLHIFFRKESTRKILYSMIFTV